MHELLIGLVRVLVETGVQFAAGAVIGAVVDKDDGLTPAAPPQPGTLDNELRKLRTLLLEYDLRFELRRAARAFLLRGIENFDGDAHELVTWHIRQPLAELINYGQVKHGDTVVVDCIDGVMRLTRTPSEPVM
ncbi:MAG: hypothetical protein IPP14_03895 [Planctomycetes bacterium]|nr:hypothetical protein [Planctomycetota bacterium]